MFGKLRCEGKKPSQRDQSSSCTNKAEIIQEPVSVMAREASKASTTASERCIILPRLRWLSTQGENSIFAKHPAPRHQTSPHLSWMKAQLQERTPDLRHAAYPLQQ